jgi:hypothetical protein
LTLLLGKFFLSGLSSIVDTLPKPNFGAIQVVDE